MSYRAVLLCLVTLTLPSALAKPPGVPPGPPFDPPGPPETPPGLAKQTVRFTVLHTNDHHGRFWRNGDGELGMAARKTLIDRITAEVEAEGGEVLLLSGGDINTGVPESDLQDAEPDFVGMNLLGYDAMAVGNHEFDNPRDVLAAQEALAQFPFLSANIYDADSGDRIFAPYQLFDVNDLSIAVVGFTTADTGKLANPDYVAGLEFRDPRDVAATLLPMIEQEHDPDLIFAVTHMGHYANGANGSNAPGDVALAESLPAGLLDMIVGGHSQNPVCVRDDGSGEYADFGPGDPCLPDNKNGTWIVQAFEWGKYVGRADFAYRKGRLTLESYALIPVNLKDDEGNVIVEPIEEDAEVLAVLQPYQDAGDEALGRVIAQSDGRLEGDRDVVRSQQTNLGRLIATAQNEVVQGAGFGIMNSGGVRASIEAGEVTYRDVLTVQPFGNTVAQATLSGDELLEYLGEVASKQIGSGAYAQFAGISMEVDCQAMSVSISAIGGVDFDPSGEYVFSIPSFNAAGGDNYPVLEVIDTGFVDAQILAEFMEELGTIQVADFEPMGEIQYLNSLSDTGCQLE
ncbi:bifunctional UDP-sugar hydrolase/5'-nucleotidase UshA [Ferrimonas balearica]|nr:bifunctional UDP-sugar hydrolase/5'-nucleotidase UshA [Ferrimonas balearica]